jgi:hypothetical protein
MMTLQNLFLSYNQKAIWFAMIIMTKAAKV